MHPLLGKSVSSPASHAAGMSLILVSQSPNLPFPCLSKIRILSFSNGFASARVEFKAYSEDQRTGLSIVSATDEKDEWAASALKYFSPGIWTHMTFTYDAENMIATIYRDGKTVVGISSQGIQIPHIISSIAASSTLQAFPSPWMLEASLI